MVIILQALPNAALVTVIYRQGHVAFSSDSEFSLLRALQHSTDPSFLSRSLYLQAVTSSLVSVLWGIAGWLYLSHHKQAGLFKTLWSVIACCEVAEDKQPASTLPQTAQASTYCLARSPGMRVYVDSAPESVICLANDCLLPVLGALSSVHAYDCTA